MVLRAGWHGAWTVVWSVFPQQQKVDLFCMQRRYFQESAQPGSWLGTWGSETTKAHICTLTARKSPCAPCQVLQLQLATTASCCRQKKKYSSGIKHCFWQERLLQSILVLGGVGNLSLLFETAETSALQNPVWKSRDLLGIVCLVT